MGDELDDDLGVGGGLEDRAVALEALLGVAEIDKVAIVRDSDQALGGLDRDRLGVEQGGVASGGVASMADGHVAGQFRKDVVSKDLGDEAHALVLVHFVAVRGSNPGGLLAAVLK